MNVSAYTYIRWSLLIPISILVVLFSIYIVSTQTVEAGGGSTPNPGVTASLSANPTSINRGQNARLHWSSSISGENYRNLRLRIDGIGAVGGSGSRSVTPSNTTTYRLVASYQYCPYVKKNWRRGECKSAWYSLSFIPWQNRSFARTARVTVIQPQCADGVDNDGDGLVDMADPACTSAGGNSEGSPNYASITSNPSAVRPGKDVTISWDLDGISGCTLSSNLSADPYAVTSETLTLSNSSTFTINCSNGSDSTSVFVLPPFQCDDGVDNDGDGLTDMDDPACTTPDDDSELPENEASISANADAVRPNKEVTITWNPDGINGCVLSSNLSGSADASGSDTLALTEETTFTINCGSGISDSVTVSVLPPFKCSDGLDNDDDGLTDMEDPACTSPDDDTEGLPNYASITADAKVVRSGGEVTVTWDPDGINGCALSSNLSGDAGVMASTTVSISSISTFTIDCSNGSDSVTVFVLPRVQET